MLILMISIAILLLVLGICFLNSIYRGSDSCTDKISEDMQITFPETGSNEPVPVLSEEMRHLMRSRCFDRDSDSSSIALLCSTPSLNRGDGDGKPTV